jgi:hypothetical protein
MLNQDALLLVLAASRESNKLRAAVDLVRNGAASADNALRVLAEGEAKGRQAEALAVLYHWAAPAIQRRALVKAGQLVGLDLRPLIPLRKVGSECVIRAAFHEGLNYDPAANLHKQLLLAWFSTHRNFELRDLAERMASGLRILPWWFGD